ncbi:MAG: outer membrane protein transport protein [Spirochaetia bacterium]|nr:outer membrane protein transport protein [Spirochaetia bacterium]
MRKLLLVLTFIIVCTGLLFAGGAENKINTGAGYARFPAKATEHKKPDAVFHNPAGTAFMKDGLYVEAGNQFLYKEYSNKLNGETYKTDVPSFFYPDFTIVWKKDKTAIFTGLTVESGGGELKYKDGNAQTVGLLAQMAARAGIPAIAGLGHSMDVYSVVFTSTTGIAHQFWEDHLSIGAGVRFLYGQQKLKVSLDDDPGAYAPIFGTDKTLAETETSGWGTGGVLSIHFKPIETIDIAATYHTEAIVDYKCTKADGNFANALGLEKGEHYNYVLPAYLALGFGWQIIPQLYVATQFNYFYNNLAEKTAERPLKYDYDDSWEIVLAAEYQINKMIAVSLGGFYSHIGNNSKEHGNSFVNPALDCFTYCGGVGLTFFDDLTVDIGAFYAPYFEKTWQNVKLDKKIFEGAISVTYRFF